MTYIIAWRTLSCACILADSVATWTVEAVGPPLSSFGQPQIFDETRTVMEGALKIRHFGSIALAFSGSSHYADVCSKEIKRRLDLGGKPESTFRGVFEDWLDPQANLASAATFIRDGRPVLLVFNPGGGRTVLELEPNQIVHLGSAPDDLKSWMTHIASLVGRDVTAPQDLLVLMLAWVQMCSVRFNLMQFGIGGAIVGVACDAKGIEWSRDILFALLDNQSRPVNLVDTVIRDNRVVVHSNYSKGISVFTDSFQSAPFANMDNIWLWVTVARANAERGKYSYVALINPDTATVMVVSMAGGRDHAQLILRTRINDGKNEIGIWLRGIAGTACLPRPAGRGPGVFLLTYAPYDYSGEPGELPWASWPGELE